MKTIKLRKLIYLREQTSGDGTPLNPYRKLEQVFTPKGNLLIENDPHRIFTEQDLFDFLNFPQKFIDNNQMLLSEHFINEVDRYLINSKKNEIKS